MSTIEDLDFPKAVLMRMIKAGLPENIAIQKEARNAVTKSATVFVSYLAAAANDSAREHGHKTIMPSDVFKALEGVGLADFIPQLTRELEAHTLLMKEKKELAAKNKAAGRDAETEDEEHAESAEHVESTEQEHVDSAEQELSAEPITIADETPAAEPTAIADETEAAAP
ncbi:hypothetical protein IWW50_006720, partial [Coemansia erecta]